MRTLIDSTIVSSWVAMRRTTTRLSAEMKAAGITDATELEWTRRPAWNGCSGFNGRYGEDERATAASSAQPTRRPASGARS